MEIFDTIRGMKTEELRKPPRVCASGVGQQIDYEDIDPSMRRLIKALNAHPDIQTFSCCEGHGRGRNQFFVWLAAKSRDGRDFLRCGARWAWRAVLDESGIRTIYDWKIVMADVREDLIGFDNSWEGYRIECDAVGEEPDAKVRAAEIRSLANKYEYLLIERWIKTLNV